MNYRRFSIFMLRFSILMSMLALLFALLLSGVLVTSASAQWLLPQDKEKAAIQKSKSKPAKASPVQESLPWSDETFADIHRQPPTDPAAPADSKSGPQEFRSRVAPRPMYGAGSLESEARFSGLHSYLTDTSRGAIPEAKKRELFQNTDVALIVDRSLSMATADCPGMKTRWEICKDAAITLATDAARYGNGDLTLVLFDNGYSSYPHVTAEEAKALFDGEELGMGTNIAGALRSQLDPFLGHGDVSTKRRLVVAVLTDGAPPAPELKDQTEAQTRKVIESGVEHIHDKNSLRISFFRIGEDPDGDDFFRYLPAKLKQEGMNYDVVRCSALGNDAGRGLMEALIRSVSATAGP